jgi:hypothetical protein
MCSNNNTHRRNRHVCAKRNRLAVRAVGLIGAVAEGPVGIGGLVFVISVQRCLLRAQPRYWGNRPPSSSSRVGNSRTSNLRSLRRRLRHPPQNNVTSWWWDIFRVDVARLRRLHAQICRLAETKPQIIGAYRGRAHRRARFDPDAREAEMLASVFAESQRAAKAAVRSDIVRAARVAPSCIECTQPPTGRSRSGS